MVQCALRHEVPSELKADYLAGCQVGVPWTSRCSQRFDLECRLAAGWITGSLRFVGRYAIVSCTAAASEPNSPHMRARVRHAPRTRDIGNRV
jgi:hypothetical protein